MIRNSHTLIGPIGASFGPFYFVSGMISPSLDYTGFGRFQHGSSIPFMQRSGPVQIRPRVVRPIEGESRLSFPPDSAFDKVRAGRAAKGALLSETELALVGVESPPLKELGGDASAKQ